MKEETLYQAFSDMNETLFDPEKLIIEKNSR